MSPLGKLIHPGLEEDDPIKRETARLAGAAYVDVFNIVMAYGGIVPAAQYATIVADLGADGFAWDGPYTGNEAAPPTNVGGDKAAAIATDDAFTRYIAGTGTVGQKFSTTDLYDGGRFFVDFDACILFGAPAGTQMQFIYRPIGTGVYDSGSFSTAGLQRNAWTRGLSPELVFSGNEAARLAAELRIYGSAGAFYCALTFARVVQTH